MRPYPEQVFRKVSGVIVVSQAGQNKGHALELLVAAGRKDFAEWNLAGVDFRGRVISGANFTDARLRGCDFRGAKREGCVFEGANIETTSGLEDIVAARAAAEVADKAEAEGMTVEAYQAAMNAAESIEDSNALEA